MGDDPCGFFNDAVFVGDSISQTLFQQATMYGELGSAQFLVRGGVSIFGFVIDHNGVYYRGSEMKVEDAIAAIGAKKVFILLGQNDLSYRSIDETMESWVLFLDAIKEKNPGIEIYLQSCVPEWHPGVLRHDKNEMIDQHNIQLNAFAE